MTELKPIPSSRRIFRKLRGQQWEWIADDIDSRWRLWSLRICIVAAIIALCAQCGIGYAHRAEFKRAPCANVADRFGLLLNQYGERICNGPVRTPQTR